MATKNFDNIGQAAASSRVHAAITDATAAEQRKERKTYTEDERAGFLATLKTSGHKGVKLPRINAAFSPELFDYIKIMSKATGMTQTEFINTIIKQYKDSHAEAYNKALEMRDML